MKTLKEALANLVAAAEKCGNQELEPAIRDAKEALKEATVVVIVCKDGKVEEAYSNEQITIGVWTGTMMNISNTKPIEVWERMADNILDLFFGELGDIIAPKK